jgi:predicted small lipoprotein YifL
MKRIAFALLLVALAGCGRKETLRPPEGVSLPPKPAMAATQPDAEKLLAPTAEQRPDREEELLKKSEVRPDDRFNLPPPG